MTSSNLSPYKQLFDHSALENLTQLKTGLSKLSQNHTDADALETTHRMAHSLKGECMAMGFESTGVLCRIIEHILAKVQSNTVEITDGLLSEIQQSVEAIERSLEKIKKENAEENLTEYQEKLITMIGDNTI